MLWATVNAVMIFTVCHRLVESASKASRNSRWSMPPMMCSMLGENS